MNGIQTANVFSKDIQREAVLFLYERNPLASDAVKSKCNRSKSSQKEKDRASSSFQSSRVNSTKKGTNLSGEEDRESEEGEEEVLLRRGNASKRKNPLESSSSDEEKSREEQKEVTEQGHGVGGKKRMRDLPVGSDARAVGSEVEESNSEVNDTHKSSRGLLKLQKELAVLAPGKERMPLSDGEKRRKGANLMPGEKGWQKEDVARVGFGKKQAAASAKSWADFKELVKREGISNRQKWRAWATPNLEKRKRLNLPFEVEKHFKDSGFPFTSFRELSQVKNRDTTNLHLWDSAMILSLKSYQMYFQVAGSVEGAGDGGAGAHRGSSREDLPLDNEEEEAEEEEEAREQDKEVQHGAKKRKRAELMSDDDGELEEADEASLVRVKPAGQDRPHGSISEGGAETGAPVKEIFSSQHLADLLCAAFPTKATMRELVRKLKAKDDAFQMVLLSCKSDGSTRVEYRKEQLAASISTCTPGDVEAAGELLQWLVKEKVLVKDDLTLAMDTVGIKHVTRDTVQQLCSKIITSWPRTSNDSFLSASESTSSMAFRVVATSSGLQKSQEAGVTHESGSGPVAAREAKRTKPDEVELSVDRAEKKMKVGYL